MKNFRYAAYAISAIGLAVLGIAYNGWTTQVIHRYQTATGARVTPVTDFWLELNTLPVTLVGAVIAALGVALIVLENRARTKRGETLTVKQYNTAFGLAFLLSPSIFFATSGFLLIAGPITVIATVLFLGHQMTSTETTKWKFSPEETAA